MIKEYVLDIDKWKCGRNVDSLLKSAGAGPTSMLNKYGYMCCLGQFALCAGVVEYNLLNHTTPVGVSNNSEDADLYDDNFVVFKENRTQHTLLSKKLMGINDDVDTSITEKIYQIFGELRLHDINLKVKGQRVLVAIGENCNPSSDNTVCRSYLYYLKKLDDAGVFVQ